MKFTLAAEAAHDAFANVLPHAGTDGTLPVLCHVQVTVADGAVTLAATDRYTLGVAELAAEEGAEDGVFLLPVAAVKELLRTAKGTKAGALDFTVADGRVTVASAYLGESREYPTGDAEFPKWRSLWPAADLAPAETSVIGLGTSHLQKFAKLYSRGRVQKMATLKFAFFGSAAKPSVVTSPQVDNFRALLMPVRLSDAEK